MVSATDPLTFTVPPFDFGAAVEPPPFAGGDPAAEAPDAGGPATMPGGCPADRDLIPEPTPAVLVR